MINKYLISFLIVLTTFVVDRLAKIFIDTFLDIQEKILIIPNIFSFEKVYNTGAAFSIFQGNTLFLILISLFTLLAIFIYIFFKRKDILVIELVSFAFIIGGALGNLFDRLTFSYVIDFIQLEFINFPIFNLADIFINIGVIIFIVSMFVAKDGK